VMVRVEDGLPVTALPMDVPEPKLPPGSNLQPEYQPESQPGDVLIERVPAPQDNVDPVERVLRNLLGISDGN
jgi:penicillin-binding protein 1A